MDSLEKIAQQVVELQQQLKSLSNTAQLKYSSIEDGSIAEFDGEGTVVGNYGKQTDGTHGAVVLNGPPPPQPTDPIVTGGTGFVSVEWDGFFAEGAARPLDMDFVRIRISDNAEMTSANLAGTLPASGAVVVRAPAGTWYVDMIAESKPGLWSTATNVVSVTSTGSVSSSDLADAISDFDQALSETQATIDGKVTIDPNSPTPADGVGKPVPALWQQVSAGVVVGNWAWDGLNWVELPLGEVMIPQIQIGSGTIGDLAGNRIQAHSIGARELVVADLQNYLMGGDFEDPFHVPLTLHANHSVVTTQKYGGNRSLQCNAAATASASTLTFPTNAQNNLLPVSPGEHYLLRVWVRVTSNYNGTGSITIRDQDGSIEPGLSGIGFDNVTIGAVDTWVLLEKDLEISDYPEDDVRFIKGTFTTNHTTGTLWIDNLELRRMNQGELTVDGSIKARKLDINDLNADTGWITHLQGQMATYLTNSDGSGFTSTVTGQGLKVTYTELDELGNVVEVQDVIKLGTFDTDYFAIHKAAQPMITMNAEGDLTSQSLNVAGSIYYRGEELSDFFATRPRGVIAWAGRGTAATTQSTGQVYPYMRLAFQDVVGRRYAVNITGLVAAITQASGAGVVNLHWTTNGTDATTSSPIIAKCQLGSAAGSTTLTTTGHIHRIFSGTGQGISLLLSFQRNQSTGFFGLAPLADSAIFMVVEDLGLNTDNVGEFLNGTAAPPPAVKDYTYEVGYSGVRSYVGNNSTYAYNTSKGYQGLSPAGYGNLKSIWTFPSVTSMLSGATITSIEAFFYFEHWYSSAGGTAQIRMHGNSSVPSTYNGTTNGMNSGGWPRGAGRWVSVPSSLFAGWQSGAYRGFALDGDGTFNTYGIANNCRLRIRYRK